MRIAGLFLGILLAAAPAADAAAGKFKTVIFGRHSDSLASFESFARQAKQSGATHIVITAEDLPWAMWQMDTPGDPYPAWAVSNVGLLKVSIPEALQPYLPKEYSDTVLGILKARCEVLRKLGLKAAFTTFEPQILPERVYEAHPLWRGPQVDHPLRSRVPRFAPSIDHPEVLALYRESIRNLLKVCPEIEILSLHTNDSGSGMSWSGGLYQGPNGSALFRERKMYQRYNDFFGTLQAGANDARPGPLEIDAEWVREATPELVAGKLGAGMAVANFEGPNATVYKAVVGFLLDYFYPFYPAQGLPLPVRYLEELERAAQSPAQRLFYLIGDRQDADLYLQIYGAFKKRPTTDDASRMQLLRSIAALRVGEENAGALVDAWMALNRVQRDADILNFGGTLFYIGGVHQRWLTRPFVPFPAELLDSETDYYRKFQFQARSETRARDLGDIQGTRQYEGLGGMAVSSQLLVRMQTDLNRARAGMRAIAASTAASAWKQRIELLDKRIQVFSILVDNCRNGLEYQYILDFARNGRLRRPIEFQEHLTDITEWRAIKEIARKEMDNSTVLADLLEANKDVLIDTAKTSGEESIRVLGPDLADQLRRKVKIMVKYWEDYERLFDEETRKSGAQVR
ncbi:MAG TPA: hypothetical protein PKJ41_11535 [Bryobacteraceae bacterium]|nr:hypothetical protein [Bryobacteraceae bacterium]